MILNTCSHCDCRPYAKILSKKGENDEVNFVLYKQFILHQSLSINSFVTYVYNYKRTFHRAHLSSSFYSIVKHFHVRSPFAFPLIDVVVGCLTYAGSFRKMPISIDLFRTCSKLIFGAWRNIGPAIPCRPSGVMCGFGVGFRVSTDKRSLIFLNFPEQVLDYSVS